MQVLKPKLHSPVQFHNKYIRQIAALSEVDNSGSLKPMTVASC